MRRASARQALWAFALRALSRTGFLAPLDACASCGVALAGGRGEAGRVGAPDSTSGALMRRAAGFSPEAGGLICARCRRGGAREEGQGSDVAERAPTFLALSPEAAAAARFLANSSSGAASRLKVSSRASASLERAVRGLAEHTLERPMPVLSPE